MKQLFFTFVFFATVTLSPFAQNSFTKVISKDRVIPSYYMEVTFDKTVHLIFPSGVTYIDLGSSSIIADKADGAENVVRVKAAIKGFKEETNFSVITDEGSFYSFIVNYSENPEKLNIEMKDFLHNEKLGNEPENSVEVYLSELGNESPQAVQMAMEKIYKTNRKKVKHVNSKQFGIEFQFRGIFSHNGLLFLHTEIKNTTDIPFDIDFLVFKIVDKRVIKRMAIQETVIEPVRAYNYLTSVKGKEAESTVFTFRKFTIPDKKQLVVELFEKNGGRHQRFVVKNGDLVKAQPCR
ncbi:Bacteroides conjugative transposon TraN protein [Tangfeifania diversioriginum]|uniref:Bacteroides conjugative transposon TraN protein n=1 Tax=Tangfeifania diversioriginum TaxID=1168035 RepID=A0A1M6MQ90_9BACT|nr:conjugative transposon protein TraN [Tangfeifania diversioriginum]SHJ85641.1 Bacteroides conjugative transposon TraN protein [Tangfeifania diversioriginum]